MIARYGFVSVLIVAFAILFIVAVNQWLWSIFCPVFGLPEMTFKQMAAFIVFFAPIFYGWIFRK